MRWWAIRSGCLSYFGPCVGSLAVPGQRAARQPEGGSVYHHTDDFHARAGQALARSAGAVLWGAIAGRGGARGAHHGEGLL